MDIAFNVIDDHLIFFLLTIKGEKNKIDIFLENNILTND